MNIKMMPSHILPHSRFHTTKLRERSLQVDNEVILVPLCGTHLH